LIKTIWTGVLTGASFSDIAKKYSKTVGIKNVAFDTLPDAMRRMVDKLVYNEVGAPVQTESGYALVKLLKRVPAKSQPLEKVRGNIVKKIKKEKVVEARTAYLQKLRSLSTIKINHDEWEKFIQESKNEKE
jgi:parvulin-like peptidyl-prolyl isomerase